MSQNNTKLVEYYFFYNNKGDKTGEIKADEVNIIKASIDYSDYIVAYNILSKKYKNWIKIPGVSYKRVTVKENINLLEKDLRDRLIKCETREKKLLERIENLEGEMKKQFPPPYKK